MALDPYDRSHGPWEFLGSGRNLKQRVNWVMIWCNLSWTVFKTKFVIAFISKQLEVLGNTRFGRSYARPVSKWQTRVLYQGYLQKIMDGHPLLSVTAITTEKR